MRKTPFFCLCILPIFYCACLGPKVPPEGKAGPAAEALARKMLAAVNHRAWEMTSAVSFTFPGGRHHFWDKKRGLAEVRWDQTRVIFNKNTMKGLVFRGGKKVTGKEAVRLLEKANAAFINDTFWLNPLFHIYSPGVRRYLIGPNQLHIQFTSGGVTPGDSYVFTADDQGLLQSMRMSVSIIPVKGFTVECRRYRLTETGVRMATHYAAGVFHLNIENLKMMKRYPERKDIFEKLVQTHGH